MFEPVCSVVCSSGSAFLPFSLCLPLFFFSSFLSERCHRRATYVLGKHNTYDSGKHHDLYMPAHCDTTVFQPTDIVSRKHVSGVRASIQVSATTYASSRRHATREEQCHAVCGCTRSPAGLSESLSQNGTTPSNQSQDTTRTTLNQSGTGAAWDWHGWRNGEVW